MEHYNLCELSSFSGCGLAADRRPTAPPRLLEIKGSLLMHKVIFAAALAVGLFTAPMSQLVSNANAQQQASADKNAKMKKEPRRWSTRHARAAEKVRRRMKGSEGCQQARERNDLAKVLERLQQTSQVRLPDSLRSLFQNARAKTAGIK